MIVLYKNLEHKPEYFLNIFGNLAENRLLFDLILAITIEYTKQSFYTEILYEIWLKNIDSLY